MRVRLALCLAAVCFSIVPFVSAQDAVKADPKHYSVASENSRVRVLNVHYGPHEKSVMHSHPDVVAVFLTDAKVQFTFPDGKKMDSTVKAGQSLFTPAGAHLPENMGDTGMDVIVIELKGKAPKPAAPAKTKTEKKK